jgi:hypothetical protein
MTKRPAEAATTTGSADQLDLLAKPLAESARDPEAVVANKKVRRSNAELERLQRATAESLGALDQHTQGRLRELIERAGDELAALIDLVLNNREASA